MLAPSKTHARTNDEVATNTETDTHASSPSYTPVVAVAPSNLIGFPTMPPIDSFDTPKEGQTNCTRWRSQNEKLITARFFQSTMSFMAMWNSEEKMHELAKNREPDGHTWNVPHFQGTQEATDLHCVPKRLHETTTGRVCAMSGKGGAIEYATVSHVWIMTDGIDWSDLSRRIGEQLSVPYVWVDKTCINQKDEDEKGQEIKRMAEYYSSATHNVIVFNDLSMAAAVNAWKEEGMEYCTPAYRQAAKVAGELMSHRYFRRVWTMQELELARHHVLLMKDGWVDGHDLDNLLRCLAKWFKGTTWDAEKADLKYMFCNCLRRKSLTSCEWQLSVREPLIDVWHRAYGRMCTDPKDIIWGMISLVKGGDRLKATYDDDLSDVLAELLALENCLGEVLMIGDAVEEGSQDDPMPCWQPQSTGEVPLIVGLVSRMENAENVQFTREERGLRANAYLIDQWSGGDKSNWNPILGGEKLFRFALRLRSWTPDNRLWYVPIWRNETSTRGVVLLDWNSEGNKIRKARTRAVGGLSTKAIALATVTEVWIEGTGL